MGISRSMFTESLFGNYVHKGITDFDEWEAEYGLGNCGRPAIIILSARVAMASASDPSH